MEQISIYIAIDLANPIAALSFLDAMETSITKLSTFPHRNPLVDEEPWRSKGIRMMPVNNFLVYYWINEETFIIHVTAIVYAKRNQIRQLAEMDIDEFYSPHPHH
jgi:toxin ParE1/3/4